VSDDCSPAFEVGGMGPVIVSVTPNQGNLVIEIPLCSGYPDTCSRGQEWRNSISPSYPVLSSYDNPVNWSSCAATESSDTCLTTYNAKQIDLDVTVWFNGLAACGAGTFHLDADCTSHRVYRYRWIKPCSGDVDVLDPTSCR
jgi:hypothetical protein